MYTFDTVQELRLAFDATFAVIFKAYSSTPSAGI